MTADSTSTDLPDGWIRLLEVGTNPDGPGYYRAQDPEQRIPAVYWVPSLDQAGEGWIEVGGDSALSIAEAELLAQRLTEAVALAKAGAR